MPIPSNASEYVAKFVTYFYQHICSGNVEEIQLMYVVTFKAISDDYFVTTPWPRCEDLRKYVNDDLFWLMYQEMYYRHLHSLRRSDLVTLEHRKASWENFCKLFDVLQNQMTTMKLPNVWLWDMIDDFIYQFGSYTHIKGSVSERTDAELEFLEKNPDVWEPCKVQHILESFVDKSGVRGIISEDGGQRLFETDGFISESNVLVMLGYFSLVGLSRLLCLLGRYESSLRMLAPLNPFNRTYLYAFKVPMANINLYFYTGTAYLMQRRYIDAARCFNTILSFIYRIKEQHRNTAAHQLILQKNEQIYILLALSIAMCPSATRWLEENIQDQLHHKCGDLLLEMNNGNMDAFKKAFGQGCPKFVTAAPPDLSPARQDNNLKGYHEALSLFLSEAEAAHQLPDLKKLLKLYTSVSTAKLASLLNTDTKTLTTVLKNMQHRCMQKRWVAGDAASGQEAPATDVEFHMDKDSSGEDIVVVSEQQMPANHLSIFAKQIVRFEQITADMDNQPLLPHNASNARSSSVAAR